MSLKLNYYIDKVLTVGSVIGSKCEEEEETALQTSAFIKKKKKNACEFLSQAIFSQYLNKSIIILGSPYDTLGATNFELHYQLTESCFLFISLLSMVDPYSPPSLLY